MGRGNRQDLYLSVNGDVRGLQNTVKVGRTVLNDFAGTAVNVLEEVEKEFQKIGAGGPPAGLKEAERAYTESFRRIGASAREAANAPTGQAAIQILDANAARAAADAATNKAAALRIVAEAATRADQATGGTSAATRAYAAAASTAAVEAHAEAAALREQAGVLGTVETQLGRLGVVQARSTSINGQARAGYQQLSYQLGDISMQYSLGTSASIIFAQQSGQVIQALQLIGGEGNKVLGFLGGPWGVALSSAAVVAAPFVAKLFEGSDAAKKEADELKKNAEQATVAADAKRAFATTEAGLIDDVRSLTEEIEKQNDALRTNAERLNIRAKSRLELLTQTRDDVSGDLTEKRASLKTLDQPGTRNERGIGLEIERLKGEIAPLETRLARIDAAIVKANAARQRTRADLAGEAADRANDPVAAIRYQYDGEDGLIERAKKRAVAEGTVTSELTRQLKVLKAARDGKIAEEQKRQQTAKGSGAANRQFGRQIDVAGATSIIESIGGRVTSGTRSRAKQEQLYADKLAGRHNGPVAKPGTSLHETGNAIDVAYGPGISVASIKKAFAEEGVALRKVLKEPGQKVYHVEFGKAGPSAATTARREKADEDRQTQNADAYAGLLSQAKEAQFRVERSRTATIEEAANLDVQAVERQRADLDRAVQKGVELDRWTQAEADAVKLITAQNASAETAAIQERARAASVSQRAELEGDALADQATLLRLQGDLATTAADRRTIARQLLKIEQDQQRIALEAAIANERDPDRKAALQGRLQQLPRVFEMQDEQLARQNDDPLQAYGRSLVDATSDMDEALKGVAANGFGALEDASSRAAAGAITDLLKIGGVAGSVINGIIQDLIRLAIQKAIVSAIGKSFFGLKDGGLVPGFADGGLPGFAGGGMPSIDQGIIRGPGTGRSDSILALVGGGRPIMVSNGEGIVNERAVQRYWPLIDAMNKGTFPRFADGGLPSIPAYPSIAAAQRGLQAPADKRPLVFDLRGAVLTADLMAQMEVIAAQTSGAVFREAAPAIVQAATGSTMAQLGRATL
jgi:hypothetical protein